MKSIHVIEDLCNGCRLCQTFCSSLRDGVFSEFARLRVVKVPGEEQDIPQLDCSGACLRTDRPGMPLCVEVCPTGALYYADSAEAREWRQAWEAARQAHGLFKVVAPWKWPYPWKGGKGRPEGGG
jgi:Fe-S-cluster-containing dehydrogenase component